MTLAGVKVALNGRLKGAAEAQGSGVHMRVVHGIWARGALCLWAEDPQLHQAAGFARGGSPRAARPHPFACPASELADVLPGLAWPGTDAVRKAGAAELTLLTPSAGHAPLASPELIRTDPAPAGPAPAGPAPAGPAPAGPVRRGPAG